MIAYTIKFSIDCIISFVSKSNGFVNYEYESNSIKVGYYFNNNNF